jgi:hypothetical protein
MSEQKCPHGIAISDECDECIKSPCCAKFGTGGCRCWEYDVMHGSKYELWETKILPLLSQVLGLQARLRAAGDELRTVGESCGYFQGAGDIYKIERDTALRELEQAKLRIAILEGARDCLGRQYNEMKKERNSAFASLALSRSATDKTRVEADAAMGELAEVRAKLADLGSKARCVYCDTVGPRTAMRQHVMSCDKRTPDRAAQVFAEASAMRDEAQALLAEAEHLALSAPGWLPIESAPLDGTWVLTFWTTTQIPEPPRVAQFTCDSWFGQNAEPLSDPTHWQPLPAPPKES